MHTDTHLNKGQNFTYQVSASNSVGWGQNSTIISATPFGVPSVPIGLMAKSGDGYVTLNWSAPSYPGPSGLVYHLFRNGTMIWSGPLLAHNDSSVVNGVIYAYKVVAESLVGWGPNSSIVSAIPISPPILPGVPVGLQASVGDGQVTLSWTAPAHAGSSKILCYEVYWGTNSTSFVPSGTAFGTNCTITGVTNGHTYYYKVSAVNAAGEGNLTEAVSATPMAPTSNGSDLFVIVGGIAAVVVVAVIGGLFYLRRKK